MDIRFLGHACFELADADTRILIDPFLTGNPKAAASADDLEPTHVFLTHGHQDHYGDIVDVAKRTGAHCVALTEIAGELESQGVEQVTNPNFGGTAPFDGGWVRVVPALHTSATPNGTVSPAAGLVINLNGTVVYHLGDTSLFSDLALPGQRDEIDVALIPIGGHFTMDRHDAALAAGLVGAKTVIPCHYNTFPLIEADAEAFKDEVEANTSSRVVILQPGETHAV
jgi:L-ascorbate metabolism protein UlaG (beta-lactamase superfamily)